MIFTQIYPLLYLMNMVNITLVDHVLYVPILLTITAGLLVQTMTSR